MNLRLGTYVISKEVRNRILNNKSRFKDKDNIITNISNDSELDFDSLDNNEFDLILSNDYNIIDNNIKVN